MQHGGRDHEQERGGRHGRRSVSRSATAGATLVRWPANSISFADTVEEFALSLPEAWPDTPWGDRVVKVGKKIFLFVSGPDSERPVITVKVPESRDHALSYPEAFPTRYGLGKHGWVTIFVDTVPEEEREVLIDFAEESFRSVATKTLVKRLDAEIAAAEPAD